MSKNLYIQSNQLKVCVNSIGAELKSVKNLNQTEFMWQGNPAIWPRTSPVLFPIVGKVLDNILLINGEKYNITQHGFARDMNFEVAHQSNNELRLKLNFNQTTLLLYPYQFELCIAYQVIDNMLTCEYEVKHVGVGEMYFSIGAHPGFCLFDELKNYVVYINSQQVLNRWNLLGGLIDKKEDKNYFENGMLQLNKALFENDALVFRNFAANQVKLKHLHTNHAITMQLSGFTDFALWTKPGTQDFLCLEPWCGHADMVNGHSDISNKPGVVKLLPQQIFKTSYKMIFES